MSPPLNRRDRNYDRKARAWYSILFLFVPRAIRSNLHGCYNAVYITVYIRYFYISVCEYFRV